MLNTQPCPICFTSLKTTQSITLPCQCTCCYSCLTDWIILKIREYNITSDDTIPCFTTQCQMKLQIQSLSLMMPEFFQEQIDHELLNIYLIKTPDIRKCPNLNCSYAGIINSSEKCSEKLECEACKTTWRDPIHISRMALRNAKVQKDEIFSYIWKILWTKRCPHCKVPIQKYSGCFYMRCTKCDQCFCWVCNDYHNRWKHAINLTIFYGLIALGVLALGFIIYQLSLIYPKESEIIKSLLRVVCLRASQVVALGFCIASMNVLLYDVWIIYKKVRKHSGNGRVEIYKEEIILMMATLCGITYFMEFYVHLLIVLMIEIPLVPLIWYCLKRYYENEEINITPKKIS